MLFILGILDVVVGILLWLVTGNPWVGSGIIAFFGVVWLIKGIWSFLSGAAEGFFFDVLGILDVLAAIFLGLSYFGIAFGFVVWIALLMVLKGIWSFFMGIRQ